MMIIGNISVEFSLIAVNRGEQITSPTDYYINANTTLLAVKNGTWGL
ncbi:MAG: hypothetical protein LBE12_10870 [Planctomycetaceae bacterium]|jgi:hypothetical protein|nr:hypothetical protein [Planctomycetaceae bacterium]